MSCKTPAGLFKRGFLVILDFVEICHSSWCFSSCDRTNLNVLKVAKGSFYNLILYLFNKTLYYMATCAISCMYYLET